VTLDRHGFSFPTVLDHDCGNESVYRAMCKPIVDQCCQGYNGSVLAYGQTTSGKTHTMLGTPSDSGVLLRAARDILAFRESTQGDRDISIYASYMELYNEQINDLLDPASTNLRLRESEAEGFYASGVKVVKCTELDDFRRLIKIGEKSRHYNKTDVHEHSSRSHTILRIVIENRMAESRRIVASEDDEQLHMSFATKYSILQLVDLAGSERLSESGNTSIEETGSINKSLFVLA